MRELRSAEVYLGLSKAGPLSFTVFTLQPYRIGLFGHGLDFKHL